MSSYDRLKLGFKKSKMKKQKRHLSPLLSIFKSRTALSAAVLLVVGGTGIAIARADNIQQQINSLNSQNSQAEGALNGLQIQATSYQDAINLLQQQISGIESAVYANQTKQAEIQQQIINDQIQLANEKKVLGEDITSMYVNGQLTTVEMLATSKNLSDFVDAETYRNAVQNQIQSEITQIANLENELESQQTQVQQLIQTEQLQQGQLSGDESQQSQLLGLNQTQQSSYTQQIQSNNNQISQLRAEQAAANASIARSVDITASGGSGGACDIGYGNGGYPNTLCRAAQDSILDAWGFPNRECTSYAYWYFVTQEGQSGFQVSGNAGWWWETSNYPVTTWNSSVAVGALGIEPSSSTPAPVPSLHGGYYGHVMVVKALPGQTYQGVSVPDGYVLVASMNEDEAGHFMFNLWPTSYLMFINPK
jgi:peptidoglycan hydrolase CwlO-like protein